MKFVNRKEELGLLEECKKLSRKKLFSLVIYGPRRVGKTRLLLEFMKEKGIYFFVNKDKTSRSLLEEYREILRNKKILGELEVLRSWDDFFEVIFKRVKGMIVFDEFQNFAYIDPAIFGVIQKLIDLNENRKDLFLVFCGSTIGLIKKVLSKKEPLYGRIKRRMRLEPLKFCEALEATEELKLNFETAIKLYSIFGGYPRYYVAVEDENLIGSGFEEIMERFFFSKNAVFEDEVSVILSLEFGKRKGLYYDILSAIASGRRTVGEIASELNRKQTSITRHINELINEFEYVKYEEPMFGGRRLLKISHPLINFWMRFFHKNLSLYLRRDGRFIENIKKNLNQYIGLRFEDICREVFPLIFKEFTKVGRQWGKIPGRPKGENQYDIDIAALNEQAKEILFGECKWQNRVNAERVVKQLSEKSRYVGWHLDERKESYAVFARSFSKRIGEFDGKKVYCFDLKDLERALKRK